ncbi:ZYBA0S05-03532g1_1 [Zygosaccharomyces bailii CLIB 213]|uniref:ZYBA0S05-03532g1_1 n=1 Tax=Zygosaccharomyces bailii (strain CLIB 213 / ATCC 58445 / CBS 680 / BCRC 21525 / NBRC 1098 / NCYC 1416 / NRRL Y-2227) TaxID=1333698 RepID=A0A8J2X8X3_ZYGB2|nr:ZYBA0S05-03532g1_1 [Zygosaccharomyces bailii CLIB 213]
MPPKELKYEDVQKFVNSKIPEELEDEILAVYAKYSMEHDMTVQDLKNYFGDLQLPESWVRMIKSADVTVEGTNVVDLDKLLRCTYHLLIFMDNEEVIDDLWQLLVSASGRDQAFPLVKLRHHVLSIKDLQRASNSAGLDQAHGIVEMMSCATGGRRIYMTYLDFAYILGKLGYLRF